MYVWQKWRYIWTDDFSANGSMSKIFTVPTNVFLNLFLKGQPPPFVGWLDYKYFLCKRYKSKCSIGGRKQPDCTWWFMVWNKIINKDFLHTSGADLKRILLDCILYRPIFTTIRGNKGNYSTLCICWGLQWFKREFPLLPRILLKFHFVTWIFVWVAFTANNVLQKKH